MASRLLAKAATSPPASCLRSSKNSLAKPRHQPSPRPSGRRAARAEHADAHDRGRAPFARRDHRPLSRGAEAAARQRARGRGATVALPIPTILKQLPGGLREDVARHAAAAGARPDHGRCRPATSGWSRCRSRKFSAMSARTPLKRRRRSAPGASCPTTGYNLFGDRANPYADRARRSPGAESQMVDLARGDARDRRTCRRTSAAVLKMDDGLREHFEQRVPPRAPPAGPRRRLRLRNSSWIRHPAPRTVAAAAELSGRTRRPSPTYRKPEGPTLDLKLAPLAAAWPGDIRAGNRGARSGDDRHAAAERRRHRTRQGPRRLLPGGKFTPGSNPQPTTPTRGRRKHRAHSCR